MSFSPSSTKKFLPAVSNGLANTIRQIDYYQTAKLMLKLKREKINNLPDLKTFSKELRNNLTPAKVTFWKIVQHKNFENRKFRRQHSVGNYILDFYRPSEKPAIERGGEFHFNDAAREYDDDYF